MDFCGSKWGGINIQTNPLYIKNDRAFKILKKGRVFIFVNKLKKVLDFQKMFVFFKVSSDCFVLIFQNFWNMFRISENVPPFRNCSQIEKMFMFSFSGISNNVPVSKFVWKCFKKHVFKFCWIFLKKIWIFCSKFSQLFRVFLWISQRKVSTN